MVALITIVGVLAYPNQRLIMLLEGLEPQFIEFRLVMLGVLASVLIFEYLLLAFTLLLVLVLQSLVLLVLAINRLAFIQLVLLAL